MKTIIPFIENPSADTEIPAKSLRLAISQNNWKEDYPYSPKVEARLWHDGNNLYINYNVDEENVAAVADKDNGDVYKDACVEFFISFDDSGYYNVEANCIGRLLLSHRKDRKTGVEHASTDILEGIKRKPSLGVDPFECREQKEPWQLTLSIPISTFFKHNFKNYRGLKAKCNIYKCGDNLPRPHFLSLYPIKAENPDFHRPEFFCPITFE